MNLFLIKNQFNQLEAVDIAGEQALSKIKDGTTVGVAIKKSRNPKHHRKFWSMAGLVFNNQDKYDTIESMVTEIKLRVGHYEEHMTVKGTLIYVPKSISFDEMDQLEFDEFYSKAVNCCLKYFVPGDNQELIDRISRF